MKRLDSVLWKYLDRAQDIVILENECVVLVISNDFSIKNKINLELEVKKLNYTIKVIPPNKVMEKESIRDILNGYSLKNKSPYSKISGMTLKVLASYTLKNLTQSKKTMFGYALKGRKKGEGVLSELKGIVVGRNSVIVPKEGQIRLIEFFKFWEVYYEIVEMYSLEKSENKR